jgi:hypothetical protein
MVSGNFDSFVWLYRLPLLFNYQDMLVFSVDFYPHAPNLVSLTPDTLDVINGYL